MKKKKRQKTGKIVERDARRGAEERERKLNLKKMKKIMKSEVK